MRRLAILAISGVLAFALGCGSAAQPTPMPEPPTATATPIPPTATATPEPTAKPTPPARTMYFCGIDRCRDSGEYGKLVFATGINVWNKAGEDFAARGGVRRNAKHAEKVEVIQEKRISEGPGGLWYQLRDGGWTNDLWLTYEPCTPANLAKYSFKDCMAGEY